MFFISITNNTISKCFDSAQVREININSKFVTVITDDFLSKYIHKPDGFSVIDDIVHFEKLIKVDYIFFSKYLAIY